MTYTKIARTKKSFKAKISTFNPASQDSILYLIQNFENFSMEKYGTADLTPELKKASDEELYDVLQSWINWNNKLAPATIRSYFSHLRKYLHYMGIKLNDQDIKAELNFKHTIHEELYGLTLSDIQSILKVMRYKNMVQYMCQLTSLMRIGEIIQLKKKHLILGQPNIIVKIPPTIAKLNKARTTFFSKEASKLLIPILKKLNDDDTVFGSSDDPKKSAYQNKVNSQSATKQVLRLAVKKAGLEQTYESTGRYTINTHSFRAYGITKISRHDPNFAKKLAGQKGYLLEYDRMNDEEKLDVYEKYEIDLIVDNSAQQKAEIKKLEKEKSELEIKNKRIEALEKRFEKQLEEDKKANKIKEDYFKLIADPNYDILKDPDFIKAFKTRNAKK